MIRKEMCDLIKTNIHTINKVTDEFKDNKIKKCLVFKKLNSEFLDKYSKLFDNEDWTNISIYQDLDIWFINKYKDELNWKYITIKNIDNDEFIINFKDKIDWSILSKYKDMNYEFILKNKSNINIKTLLNDNKNVKVSLLLKIYLKMMY